jgi:hypothetical protein
MMQRGSLPPRRWGGRNLNKPGMGPSAPKPRPRLRKSAAILRQFCSVERRSLPPSGGPHSLNVISYRWVWVKMLQEAEGKGLRGTGLRGTTIGDTRSVTVVVAVE